jgi:hypothetical protein
MDDVKLDKNIYEVKRWRMGVLDRAEGVSVVSEAKARLNGV